jgi:ribonucleoside-diphosphate reductase alpha chain
MTAFINEFSEEVWKSTYKDHNDLSVDDTIKRVAESIASVESTPELQKKWQDIFEDTLRDFKNTCGGRTYSNAGTEFGGTTLANCFVSPRIGNDLDSLDQIINDLKNQAMTLKSEGGWGQNFSWIRPRGSFIHGVGVETPGAVKYMELYDKASDIITAGSGKKSKNSKAKGKIRKGAMMGVLDVTHPDIIEFITAKQHDRLSKFNMSVNCTDAFMEKLNTVLSYAGDITSDEYKELDKWELIFPDTTHKEYKNKWNGIISNWIADGLPVVTHNTISVKWLWNLIMESTYNRAEPGVLFLDRANKYNPLNYGETIVSTNPCLRGDTMVSTTDGDITIFDLIEKFESGEKITIKTFNIDTNMVEIETVVNALMTSSNRELLELAFDDGKIIRLTPDHKVYTKNRGYVEAKDLTEYDDFVVA